MIMLNSIFGNRITYLGKRDKNKTKYYNEILEVEDLLKVNKLKLTELEETKRLLLQDDIPFNSFEEQYYLIFNNIKEAVNMSTDVGKINRNKLINVIRKLSFQLRESNRMIEMKDDSDRVDELNELISKMNSSGDSLMKP